LVVEEPGHADELALPECDERPLSRRQPAAPPLLLGDRDRTVEREVAERVGDELAVEPPAQLGATVERHDLDPVRHVRVRLVAVDRAYLLELAVALHEAEAR